MFILSCLRANVVYTKDYLPCFKELIKSLINGLSLRVVSKPNLLCKVRFEVFSNIINYYWNKTKPGKCNGMIEGMVRGVGGLGVGIG